MKTKEGYMLRQIAGKWVVIPFGERVVEFNSIITLNDTGAKIWKGLEKGESKDVILEDLLAEFNADKHTASMDFDEFVNLLRTNGLLES